MERQDKRDRNVWGGVMGEVQVSTQGCSVIHWDYRKFHRAVLRQDGDVCGRHVLENDTWTIAYTC